MRIWHPLKTVSTSPSLRCSVALLFAQVLSLVMLCAGHRAAAAEPVQTNGFRFIDLSGLRTASAALGRPASVLPPGMRAFHSVPFRVDSAVGVTGIELARAGELLPSAVSVEIGGKGQRIHLLHGTMFPDRDGVPIAKLVFHYADGKAESVRLGYGVHVRDWIAPRLEKRSALLDPNSQLAWSEPDESRGTTTRIFQTSLENPRPAEVIERITIESLFSRAAPFIVALTIQEAGSRLVSDRQPAARKRLTAMSW
jgi:hypothetical protein